MFSIRHHAQLQKTKRPLCRIHRKVFQLSFENNLGFAPWSVQRTLITLSTNQVQSLHQSRLGRPGFPALLAVCLFSPWILLLELFHDNNDLSKGKEIETCSRCITRIYCVDVKCDVNRCISHKFSNLRHQRRHGFVPAVLSGNYLETLREWEKVVKRMDKIMFNLLSKAS